MCIFSSVLAVPDGYDHGHGCSYGLLVQFDSVSPGPPNSSQYACYSKKCEGKEAKGLR